MQHSSNHAIHNTRCCPLRTSSSSHLPPKLENLVTDTLDSDRKIIVVTGGVLSGIGKGVTASSIGVLFRAMNYRVTALKIDPYLNVDAGTMSPFEHGEVFVLDDGGETDLDLGNYERFLSVSLTKDSNLSTGKIYQSVIERERVGEYLGKTVQVVPHISDAIQEWILKVAQTPVSRFSKVATGNDDDNAKDEPPEVCIVELGGTLGDIESMPFVEALRQLQENLGWKNLCFVHVSLVPVLGDPAEQKTKPTQHSVKQMMQMGLRPDFLCCRGKEQLEPSTVSKLSLFTSVPKGAIVSLHDVSNIYRVPLMMIEQNLHSMLAQRLRLLPNELGVDYSMVESQTQIEDSDVIKDWRKLADSVDEPESECVIGIVGKYIEQGDAYLSVVKALTHASIATKQRLRIEWIEASSLCQDSDDDSTESISDETAWDRLTNCDGVVVPGGFGTRGMAGKIRTIQYLRENKVPFLGICLGMQATVIEYCRNVLGIQKAHSAEFFDDLVKDEEDAVIFMPEGDRTRLGGTMRLGARETILKENSIARKMYGSETVMERHRHRYEVNPALVPRLEDEGLQFVGRNTDASGERMEVCELSEDVHPYFMACQYHPEFTSRPELPNPLFLGLLQTCKRIIAAKSKAAVVKAS